MSHRYSLSTHFHCMGHPMADTKASLPNNYQHQSGPDYIIPTNEIRTWKRNGATKIDLTVSGQTPEPISVLTAFKQCVDKYHGSQALHLERDGIVTKMTFGELYKQVRIVAKAFIKLGLKRFHSACILGFNSPEWLIAQMAAVFAGGLASGIYPTSFPEACKYVLSDGGANICLVDTEEQLNKILTVRKDLPELKIIIQWLGKPKVEGILSWDDLIAIGKNFPEEFLEERIREIAINQACLLVYTSGTTAHPKGVLLNHDNIIFGNWQTVFERKNVAPGDKVVSYLPWNHLGGQIIDVFPCIFLGQTIHFAKPDALKGSLMETLVLAQPTIFLGPPRIFEKIYSRVKSSEKDMSLIQRKIFSWARSVGLKHSQNRMAGLDSEPFLYGVAKSLVFGELHKKLGLCRARYICSSTAPINVEILKYIHSLDLFVEEVYGLTETLGLTTTNEFGSYCMGSVGKSTKYIKCKIADADQLGNGEICFKGRNIFMGYLNKEQETLEAIDDQWFFHTGDLGQLDADGFLHMVGRKKEILVTAGGENIAPVPIEDNVKRELDIISNVMAVADNRKFLSVLLTLKTEVDVNGNVADKLSENVKRWLRDKGSNATTVTELLGNFTDSIRLGIQSGIDGANMSAISNAAKIKKWAILPHDFSIATGELSPTMKLCRYMVTEKYKRVIDNLYRDT